MPEFIRTKMMNRYMLKLAIRILIFIVVFIFYVLHKDLLCDLMTQSIWLGITPLHALWMVFMLMMFTPMLFIRNFFSWSLFFTSCVVLIHWEVIYAKHPERFWSGSNQTLQCEHCKDKTCQIKKKLSSKISLL